MVIPVEPLSLMQLSLVHLLCHQLQAQPVLLIKKMKRFHNHSNNYGFKGAQFRHLTSKFCNSVGMIMINVIHRKYVEKGKVMTDGEA